MPLGRVLFYMANGTLGEIPSSGYNPVRVALDPNDPQFLKKLGMVGAMEGQHELNSNANENATPPMQAAENAPTMGTPAPKAPQQNDVMARSPEQMAGTPSSMPSPNITLGATYPPGASIGSATGEIANVKPQRSLLGKIGHGLEVAGNVAGDIFAPSTMALIPGTQLGKERQANVQFQHGIEKERLQEEMDYRTIMGQVAAERAQTGAAAEKTGEKAEATRETAEKFNEDYKTQLLDFDKGKQAFTEAIDTGKLDMAHQALQGRLEQMRKMFTIAEDRLGLEGARNALAAQMNGIRQEMVDVSKLGLTQKGTEEGIKAEQSLNTMLSQHWLQDAFGNFDDLKAEVLGTEPLPGATKPTGGAAPASAPTGAKKKVLKYDPATGTVH